MPPSARGLRPRRVGHLLAGGGLAVPGGRQLRCGLPGAAASPAGYTLVDASGAAIALAVLAWVTPPFDTTLYGYTPVSTSPAGARCNVTARSLSSIRPSERCRGRYAPKSFPATARNGAGAFQRRRRPAGAEPRCTRGPARFPPSPRRLGGPGLRHRRRRRGHRAGSLFCRAGGLRRRLFRLDDVGRYRRPALPGVAGRLGAGALVLAFPHARGTESVLPLGGPGGGQRLVRPERSLSLVSPPDWGSVSRV